MDPDQLASEKPADLILHCFQYQHISWFDLDLRCFQNQHLSGFDLDLHCFQNNIYLGLASNDLNLVDQW